MFLSNKEQLEPCHLVLETVSIALQRQFMKLFIRPVDLTSVNTIVYHLPDGPSLSLNINGIEEFLDLELEQGHYCDTSDIDGTLHFFPKGNA